MSDKLRIVFMGTPDFAVETLDRLIKDEFNVVAVITAPDKPAGRGQKLSESAVKQYAKAHDLPILQPTNLKEDGFLNDLRSYKADLQVVVAFRMLPEIVWNMPSKGTINLHASLLPQYRGAAPINWAVINGEKESGVSTFFLKQEIDTGDIILQESVRIDENDTAGDLHDNLMHTGAGLLSKTVALIAEGKTSAKSQSIIIEELAELMHAPKIFKTDCKINWNNSNQQVHNFVRGLSPYPTAWSVLIDENKKEITTKVFKTIVSNNILEVGQILIEENKNLYVGCTQGSIQILELQLAGKKRMKTEDFLRGGKLTNEWKFE